MKSVDDYEWDKYTKEYSDQIKNSVAIDNDLIVKNFVINGNTIKFVDNLHGNWKEVYHQVLVKKVKSVFECGCGSCQHLLNLSVINSDLKIAGCDLLQSQIDFGKEYYDVPNEILNNVKIMDFSKKYACKLVKDQYDFVFTQAVLMHICHDKAVNFIRNMLMISKKYLLMVERYEDHNYIAIIRKLEEELGLNLKIEMTHKYAKNGILVKRI